VYWRVTGDKCFTRKYQNNAKLLSKTYLAREEDGRIRSKRNLFTKGRAFLVRFGFSECGSLKERKKDEK
jgi:hypothetical protein